MDRLCKIWDVSPSATVSTTTLSEDSAGDLHRYDDRYFLDPETLRKERDTSENVSNEFIKEEKKHDASKVDDERESKKSRIE